MRQTHEQRHNTTQDKVPKPKYLNMRTGTADTMQDKQDDANANASARRDRQTLWVLCTS